MNGKRTRKRRVKRKQLTEILEHEGALLNSLQSLDSPALVGRAIDAQLHPPPALHHAVRAALVAITLSVALEDGSS